MVDRAEWQQGLITEQDEYTDSCVVYASISWKLNVFFQTGLQYETSFVLSVIDSLPLFPDIVSREFNLSTNFLIFISRTFFLPSHEILTV